MENKNTPQVNSSDKTLNTVNKTKKNLKKYRSQFEKNWKEEEDAYHGRLWKNHHGYRPYENFLFQVVEGEVPILTDGFPSTTVKVLDPEKVPQAKILDKAVKWVYSNQDFNLKLPMVIRECLISAPSYIHPYYDANANNGQGEIKHEIVKWQNVYLHGGSRFVDDLESARIEVPRSRNWLMLNYKKYKKELKDAKAPDDWGYGEEGREREDTGNTNYAQRNPPKIYKDEDQLQLVKTFVRDYSIVKIPIEETESEVQAEAESLENGGALDVAKWQDHAEHVKFHTLAMGEIYGQLGLTVNDGYEMAEQAVEQIAAESPESGVEELLLKLKILENHIKEHQILAEENPNGGKLKYPKGLRCIETVDKIVLYDGPSRDDHEEIPLVPFYCYRNTTPYGFGELRNIMDSQRMQATLQFKEYKGLQRVANPAVIVDEETGLTEDDITNEDGAIYVIPQGTNIRDKSPGQVSPQIGQFINDRKQAISDISGINEVTQGKMPSPNASGVTVERVQQQAIGRIRLKDRQNQHYSIKRLGKLTASLVVQYWTEDKIIDLDNSNGDFEQVIYSPMDAQDLDFNIDIAQGSMAGVDKDAFNAQLFNFLQTGNITFDEFLEVAEMPRMNKISELVKQRNDKDAQIEELNNQLILAKGDLNPESLAPEELEVYEQLKAQEQEGANQGQPE